MERRRRRFEEEVTILSKDKFESQKTDFECVNCARKIRERERFAAEKLPAKTIRISSVYVYVFILVLFRVIY